VADKRSEGLLVDARPLSVLLLDADPAWAGAINTVLVKSGVRVNELRRADDRRTSKVEDLASPPRQTLPRKARLRSRARATSGGKKRRRESRFLE